jgi:hypothetical protein
MVMSQPASPLRVIRDHQEVQRPVQLNALAVTGEHLLATGEPEAHVGAECVSDQSAVHGKRGVVVGISEEHALREVLIDVGRIGFGLFHLLVFVQRPLLSQRRAAQPNQEFGAKCEQNCENAAQFRSWIPH